MPALLRASSASYLKPHSSPCNVLAQVAVPVWGPVSGLSGEITGSLEARDSVSTLPLKQNSQMCTDTYVSRTLLNEQHTE